MSYFVAHASIAQATVNTTPELRPLLDTLLVLFVVSACALMFAALHRRF